jgi:catechol 2,3-dioxygenase-like lactoylglutathione lyase family enzyme
MEVTKEETGGYEGAGLGKNGKPSFWIDGRGATVPTTHVAFVADDRAAVDAFHAAAIAAGGRDNGKPGLRPHYHPNYYAAFVFDPDGHNIEAVCHKPA